MDELLARLREIADEKHLTLSFELNTDAGVSWVILHDHAAGVTVARSIDLIALEQHKLETKTVIDDLLNLLKN